jgi:hypothetical protein
MQYHVSQSKMMPPRVVTHLVSRRNLAAGYEYCQANPGPFTHALASALTKANYERDMFNKSARENSIADDCFRSVKPAACGCRRGTGADSLRSGGSIFANRFVVGEAIFSTFARKAIRWPAPSTGFLIRWCRSATTETEKLPLPIFEKIERGPFRLSSTLAFRNFKNRVA